MAMEGWTGFQLSVPSIQYSLQDDSVFEYKLPYTVPSAPCCTRIHPMLYCCDKTLCCCVPKKTGQLPFIDVVNQTDGHQLRFRTENACCMEPRVMAFEDGQYVGHLSRTMRCCNKCRVCCEDFRKQPVLQVGLHDSGGKQFARIDRVGRGSCCECGIDAPMKCTGCCYTCLMCTCAVRPGPVSPCCGLNSCDPVCCDCCVRGDTTLCACMDQTCCCIGLPCCVPAIWCPCPSCETSRFDNTGTIRYRDFDVVDSNSSTQVGILQAQYRGNFPSAYVHAEEEAFKVTGHMQDSRAGKLLAGTAAGMVYAMGQAFPVFSGMVTKPAGTSPPFDGHVKVYDSDQMKLLVGLGNGQPTLREDMVVGSSCILGQHLSAVQVHGWELTRIGYQSPLLEVCGVGILGKSREPRTAHSIKMVQDMVKSALESQNGNYGTTFNLYFELPDQEKAVAKRGGNAFGEANVFADGFNPPRGGFIDQMEEVACAITCNRYCRFPCNTAPDKTVCCRCPLYARATKDSSTKVVSSAWASVAPPMVVMVGAPKDKWMTTIAK